MNYKHCAIRESKAKSFNGRYTGLSNLIVLPANAKDYTPVAQYSVANSPTWAHPVVIGNRILIKDETTLRSLVF